MDKPGKWVGFTLSTSGMFSNFQREVHGYDQDTVSQEIIDDLELDEAEKERVYMVSAGQYKLFCHCMNEALRILRQAGQCAEVGDYQGVHSALYGLGFTDTQEPLPAPQPPLTPYQQAAGRVSAAGAELAKPVVKMLTNALEGVTWAIKKLPRNKTLTLTLLETAKGTPLEGSPIVQLNERMDIIAKRYGLPVVELDAAKMTVAQCMAIGSCPWHLIQCLNSYFPGTLSAGCQATKNSLGQLQHDAEHKKLLPHEYLPGVFAVMHSQLKQI